MIRLRDVRTDELPDLGEMCLRSKAVWGYDDAFMTACRSELTLNPNELRSTHLQLAQRDTRVVGLAQVKIVGEDAELMKLFVEPTELKSGVGGLLFEWACVRARELGAIRMVIDADPDAATFYERMGARQVGFTASQSIVARMLPRLQIELVQR